MDFTFKFCTSDNRGRMLYTFHPSRIYGGSTNRLVSKLAASYARVAFKIDTRYSISIQEEREVRVRTYFTRKVW